MKSISETLRENKKELIEFLKTQPNNKYTFVERDEEDRTQWVNPNEDDGYYCDIEDCAPFVTYSDDNGNVNEYFVASMTYNEEKKEVDLELYAVDDYSDTFSVPISWLYGVSECYIYEMMIDLNLV